MYKNIKIQTILIVTLSLLIASILAYFFYHIDKQNINEYLQQLLPSGLYGMAVFILILSIATSIGLPRQIAAFTAGFAFGSLQGTILATLAATIGCFITIKFSHFFFSKFIKNKYPAQLDRLSDFFATQTFSKAFIIRLLPAGSNFITNVIAGTAKVPTKPYILGSGLGFIPQMFIFSLGGSGIQLADKDQLIISIVLFIVALFLGFLLYRYSKIAKNLSTNT